MSGPGRHPAHRSARRADDRGISTAEVVVAVAIALVVMTATTSIAVSMLRAERYNTALRADLDGARVAVDRVRRELRGARQVTVAPGGARVDFWLDRNRDLAVQPSERVAYALVADGTGAGAGGRLERWTAAAPTPTQVVVRGLGPPTTGQPAFAVAAGSRVVTVTLVADVPVANGPPPLAHTAQVRLRNAP